MRLLAILGLCLVFSTAAFAQRNCDPCDVINESICPIDDWQLVSGTTAGEPNSDYAYSFGAGAGGTFVFSFCTGGGHAEFDTEMSVQGPDTCGQYLTCNDDYCGLQSQVTFTAPYDGTFIVVVDGYSSNTGTYTLAYRGPGDPSPAEHTAWGTIKALFR